MSNDGVCKIKPEYIEDDHKREVNLECVSKVDKEQLESQQEPHNGDVKNEAECPEPCKKRTKLSKSEKKLRGQNKSRPNTFKQDIETEICKSLLSITEDSECACKKTQCRYMHDIQEYLKTKPKDIGDHCYNFTNSGYCSRGLSCRFGSKHISANGFTIVDNSKYLVYQENNPLSNNQLKFELQNALRKRSYDFQMSEALVKYNDKLNKRVAPEGAPVRSQGAITDEDVIKLLQREKKRIDWTNKLFLSPLTTVGNLPFRRICKEFGVDVTCGEMAMCSALLQGAMQEWALVKRHHTEKIFGVQLCANNPHLLTKCGQLLENEIDIDFIDLNLGCPIELVYKEGAGSGLLRRPKVLESCVRNLSSILTIPLTVKTRTGVYTNESIAHTLVPKFKEWGADLVTVHGRSREQRYTKTADWDYIARCAQTVAPFPVLGNGDIMNYKDYKTAMDTCPELTGIMIARGALIKPWIFTEIKEQKLWDISSAERFDIIKKYVNYGLEHWGSDTKGVENTRRFLLEWLSFLYRYIPVGILECPPQKINERPPRYHGRDDLETLFCSPSASDWVKISEMLLGPVPEGFQFLPKHKANSYN